VYRNSLRPGQTLAFLAADGREVREHATRLFDVDAGRKTPMDIAWPGQIVLLGGLRSAATGDTLCDPKHLLLLERIETRQPVISLAVEPASSSDEEKFLEVIGKVLEEDPTLQLHEDPETGQRLLRGMGELHLQIVLERLQREFNLRLRSGKPAVALRETILRPAVADFLFHPPAVPEHKVPEIRARVLVQIAPRPRGAGLEVGIKPVIKPEGAKLSLEQTTALEQGVRFALTSGPLEGAPLEDVAVELTGVELFGAASTPNALSAAASRAVHKALEDAGAAMLHPVMKVEVVVPETNLGAVLGDLQSRHALIRSSETWGDSVTLDCEVALDHLLGYTTDLRSLTQGRGQFSMIFSRFDTLSG
jgi:elongation factor G